MPGPAIALIDGEHHPAAVRDALDALERERPLAGVVFCGGEEKVPDSVLAASEQHYGRPVTVGEEPVAALLRLAAEGGAEVVVDLADEPILPAPDKLRLAAVALHLGLDYEAPGTRIAAPRYEPVDFPGPKLAVIATGKRTGKTAVAGHWATLLRDRGVRAAIVSMGRGGPPEPELARAGIGLDELVELVEAGRHGASDYLEDAALANVDAVGCRRVGGGLAGEPYESNVAEGARLAIEPDAIVFEGSGACVPPVEVDRTVCIARERAATLDELGPYRLLRADLALVMDEAIADEVAAICPGETLLCELRPEPTEDVPADARVALFSTGPVPCDGVEAIVTSSNLARRKALAEDLDRAAAERCDLYLVELKAAAIDTVAARAREEGARVVFLRNRPVGRDGDLDRALVKLYEDA